jgi:hypothetical protein
VTREFRKPQWLPGWFDQSIWGYDETMQRLFAQLWRDDDSSRWMRVPYRTMAAMPIPFVTRTIRAGF